MPYLRPHELNAALSGSHIESVYLFVGEEPYLQHEALKSLVSALHIDPLNHEVFYGNETAIENIILAAQTLPFLSEKRLIVVKNAHKYKSADLARLAEFIRVPMPSTCLILLWPEKLRPENKKTALFKAIEKSGCIIDCRALYERELPAWIQQKARQLNKSISFDAVTCLIQESGANLMDLNNELEKLALFIGKKSEITLKDVEILSGHTKQVTLNNLQESIESKNLAMSIQIAGNLVREGEIPLKILATIYRTVRRLLIAKSMLEEHRCEQQQVREELRIHPYFAQIFFSRLSRFTLKELKHNVEVLVESDRLLKSSNTPPELIIEDLLFTLVKTS